MTRFSNRSIIRIHYYIIRNQTWHKHTIDKWLHEIVLVNLHKSQIIELRKLSLDPVIAKIDKEKMTRQLSDFAANYILKTIKEKIFSKI